jgi:hypothetical protein
LEKLKKLPLSQAGSSAQRRTTQSNLNNNATNPNNPTWSSSYPSSDLQNRLLRLVGGYWDVATRLIDIAKRKNPGMPEHWYWEKVIEDIESDR